MIMEQNYTATELCNLFDVEELVLHLGVSKRTAQRYHNGDSRPPKGFVTLLRSIHNGRILPDSWPKTMRINGDRLYTGMTSNGLTYGSIEQFEWILAQWHFSLDSIMKLELKLQAVMNRLSTEEMMEMLPLRKELIMSASEAGPYKLSAKEFRRLSGC